MANSSSEDETDTLPERPTRIQPYQFESVRQDFERVPEHRVSFEANPMFEGLVSAFLYFFNEKPKTCRFVVAAVFVLWLLLFVVVFSSVNHFW